MVQRGRDHFHGFREAVAMGRRWKEWESWLCCSGGKEQVNQGVEEPTSRIQKQERKTRTRKESDECVGERKERKKRKRVVNKYRANRRVDCLSLWLAGVGQQQNAVGDSAICRRHSTRYLNKVTWLSWITASYICFLSSPAILHAQTTMLENRWKRSSFSSSWICLFRQLEIHQATIHNTIEVLFTL